MLARGPCNGSKKLLSFCNLGSWINGAQYLNARKYSKKPNIQILGPPGSKIQDCRKRFRGSILDPAGPVFKYVFFLSILTLACDAWNGSKHPYKKDPNRDPSLENYPSSKGRLGILVLCLSGT